MSYQPYPSGGDQSTPQLIGGPAPQTVQNAIKLMYAGAAVSVVDIIITIATASSVRSRIAKNPPKINGKVADAAQISQLAHFLTGFLLIEGVVGLALWLLMAWKSGQGRSWARIMSSVLFGFSTLSLLFLARGGQTVLGIAVVLVTWLIGLGAIVLLWRSASSTFFNAGRRPK